MTRSAQTALALAVGATMMFSGTGTALAAGAAQPTLVAKDSRDDVRKSAKDARKADKKAAAEAREAAKAAARTAKDLVNLERDSPRSAGP